MRQRISVFSAPPPDRTDEAIELGMPPPSLKCGSVRPNSYLVKEKTAFRLALAVHFGNNPKS